MFQFTPTTWFHERTFPRRSCIHCTFRALGAKPNEVRGPPCLGVKSVYLADVVGFQTQGLGLRVAREEQDSASFRIPSRHFFDEFDVEVPDLPLRSSGHRIAGAFLVDDTEKARRRLQPA